MASQARVFSARGARRSSSSPTQDDGLDAPGRPVSRGSGHEMEIHDVGQHEDEFDSGEFQAASMEAEPSPEDIGVVARKSALPAAPTPWTKFRRGVRSIWAGKLPEDADKDTIVRRTLRELIVYALFVCIFSVVVFGMTTPNKFYLTNFLEGLYLDQIFNDTRSNFRQAATIADFWRFAGPDTVMGVIAVQLFGQWESFYNGEANPDMNYVLYENKLLGVPRFRQVRVRNDSCTVHPDFADEIKQCYAAYSPEAEDNTTYGPASSPWKYQTEKQLNGMSYTGKVAQYGGGGFVVYLNRTSSQYAALAQSLQDNLWIDRATRAVFLDFTLYNANVNLFSIIKLVSEFPPTGGMITSYVLFTTKLNKYDRNSDYVVLVCEIIFIMFTLYYIVEEALEFKSLGLKKYFKDIWNWLDTIIIMMSVLAVVFNLYSYMEVTDTLEGLLMDPSAFPNFEFIRLSQDTYETAIAALVFFVWMKIFKYISFNKTMMQLSTTMSRCKNDLLGFGVMFFIIFLAFTQLAYLLFGTQIDDFKNFPYAMLALFRILLGDFDFGQLEAAQRVLGPIFFIAYMFFVFFVLLNMFLAIIGDTYSEVKAETANEKSALEMSEFFKKKYSDMLGKMRTKRDKLVAIENALGKTGAFNMEQFKIHLKEQGYTDSEVDAVVAKYDINGDRELSEEEVQRMKDDLEGQRANLAREYDDIEERVASANSRAKSRNREREESSSSSDDDDEEDGNGRRVRRTKSGRPIAGLTQEEFSGLTRRVDRMEHSISSIVSKIDGVLIKLEAMEKAKLKRKETMGKLLDSINEADGTTDEMKRDQMERLVREELERWDSEGLPDQQSSSRHSLGSLGSLKAGGGQSSSRVPTARNK